MTKFEEDLNNKINLKEVPMYFTQSGCSLTRKTYIETNWIFDNYKNYHSDEEFQAEKDARKKEYEIHQDIYSKTSAELNKAELEIADLKSQLQQQALPVVPECVAGIIKKYKGRQSVYGVLKTIALNRKTDIYEWVFSEGNQNIFALAFITGKYEDEKPQLFYLKNKLTTSYLALDINTGYYEHWGEEIIPKLPKKQGYKIAFTQQEIASMQTGSYEQIEVTE